MPTGFNNSNDALQFQDMDFQPILSLEEQMDIDAFLNQLVTEDYYQPPQSYSNYPLQHNYSRLTPHTPYLMSVSQNQMQPPVPAGPLVTGSNPLFQNQLFSRPKYNSRPPPMNLQIYSPISPPHVPESPIEKSQNTIYPSSPQELSEDQKKLNHIKSEKKRRQIIRQGFGKLEYLLFEKQPGIQFSQSQKVKSRSEATMLKLTVEYIQKLIQQYKQEYITLLRHQYCLGIKTAQQVQEELRKITINPTFNITYKTQMKIRTYKRVVYNNNKVK